MIERITYTAGGYRISCDCCKGTIAEHDEFSSAIALARHNGGYLEADGQRWYCRPCILSGKAQRGEES